MKKILISVVLLSINIFAQAEFVEAGHPAYDFLERMENLHILNNYNSFEIPKARNEIASYLKEVIRHEKKLNKTDKEILNDLKSEFELEIYGTLNNSSSIINGAYNLFSQKEKYIYYLAEEGEANLFINLSGSAKLIYLDENISGNKYSSALGIAGGQVRGTILNKFGFLLKGTNGKVFGDKKAAFILPELQYNFKINEKPEEAFFDETEGYLTADFDLIRFKIGRDRVNIGYGRNNSILSSRYPLFDYIGMNINYKFFNYSFFHGKLLGELSLVHDPAGGGGFHIPEKYIGYHRIGFNISRHLDFGFGELIVYGDRPLDLTYLNPFTFYKSVEHSNRDRDNAMIFFDINNNSLRGLKFYFTLLIDDIAFSKLGTGWWGNQSLIDAGVQSENLYEFIPATIGFGYTRVEPYTFTHRFKRNNFTNYGYNLSSHQPNSESFLSFIDYRLTNRLSAKTEFSYTVHGANPVEKGFVKNVGGNIALGRRVSDAETAFFLDGDLEYSRRITLLLSYEPINQVKFDIVLNYINESLQNSIRNKELQVIGSLNMIF